MAATKVHVVCNPTRIDPITEEFQQVMLVIPDDDAQLNDPAFNPAGHFAFQIDKHDWETGDQNFVTAAITVAADNLGLATTREQLLAFSNRLIALSEQIEADLLSLHEGLVNGP